MTPKQKQQSDLMFKVLSKIVRRRAEQINPRKKVESKQVKK